MEKENMKKTSADKERRKKLTNAILMAFVCILMMSGATYAWFTMSNTAKVTSLKLNVAAEGSLYIDTTENGVKTKANEGTKEDMPWPSTTNDKTLYPCTSETGIAMKKPVYTSEEVVDSLKDIDGGASSTEKDMYYIEQVFYLLMDEGDSSSTDNQTYDVCLVQRGTEQNGTYDGTYFTAGNGGYCARVSFQLEADTTKASAVYEPNSDGTLGGTPTKATDNTNLTAYESKHKQLTDSGEFSSSDVNNTTGNSDKLFQIEGDIPTKVTVRIWFEGTDEQCCNEIATNEIAGQLKFIANKVETTTGNNGN